MSGVKDWFGARCRFCGQFVTNENALYIFTPDTAFSGERHEWQHKDQCPRRGFCFQCGKSYSARACGPTHAMIADERRKVTR